VQFHDRTHFDCAVALKNGAALGKFHRLIEVVGFNQGVATNNVLYLSKRSVNDGFLLALDHFASTLQRLATVLNVAFLRQFLEPVHPLLHYLLHFGGGSLSGSTPVQKYKIVHFFPPLILSHFLSINARNTPPRASLFFFNPPRRLPWAC